MNRPALQSVDAALAALEQLPSQVSETGDSEMMDAIGRITASLQNLRAHFDGSAAPAPASPGLQALRRKIAQRGQRYRRTHH